MAVAPGDNLSRKYAEMHDGSGMCEFYDGAFGTDAQFTQSSYARFLQHYEEYDGRLQELNEQGERTRNLPKVIRRVFFSIARNTDINLTLVFDITNGD